MNGVLRARAQSDWPPPESAPKLPSNDPKGVWLKEGDREQNENENENENEKEKEKESHQN